MALLFFYVGTVVDKLKIENRLQCKPWWVEALLVIVLYIIYFLLKPSVVFRDNSYPSGYLTSIIGLLSIVLCIYFAVHIIIKRCSIYPRILPWFGVNSMVVLCSHHLIYRPIEYGLGRIGINSNLIVFVTTVLLTALVVIVCSKYIPILAGKLSTNKN